MNIKLVRFVVWGEEDLGGSKTVSNPWVFGLPLVVLLSEVNMLGNLFCYLGRRLDNFSHLVKNKVTDVK